MRRRGHAPLNDRFAGRLVDIVLDGVLPRGPGSIGSVDDGVGLGVSSMRRRAVSDLL